MRIESDEDPRSRGLFPGREGSAAGPFPVPIVHAGYATLSLRQVDAWNGVPKGTAFRLFKAQQDQLTEGKDFFYIPEGSRPTLTETLRLEGRIYPSTVHLVLLTGAAYERLREEWHRRMHRPGCGCPE